MEKFGSRINIPDRQYFTEVIQNNGELTQADVRELREVVARAVELSAPEFLHNFGAKQGMESRDIFISGIFS